MSSVRFNRSDRDREYLKLGQNRYEIVKQLSLPDRGRWLVHHHRPHPNGTNYVAVVLPDSDATAQLRRTLTRLPSHANSLPTLIDHGRVGDKYCLLVQWWNGIDLDEYLGRVLASRTVRPSPTECVRLFRSVAHSLRLLHEVCQVVHGDLKPANLVVTSKPTSLRLIDFGSSWQLERTWNRVEGDGSDPTFTAPEMFTKDAPVGAACDQFSVGVLFYLMLTLKVPFDGLGGKAGHINYRDEFTDNQYQLTPPSQFIESSERIPKNVLHEMDLLSLRMLRIDPSERFPNSRSWTNAFDRLDIKIKQAIHAEPNSDSFLGHMWEILKRLGKR